MSEHEHKRAISEAALTPTEVPMKYDTSAALGGSFWWKSCNSSEFSWLSKHAYPVRYKIGFSRGRWIAHLWGEQAKGWTDQSKGQPINTPARVNLAGRDFDVGKL